MSAILSSELVIGNLLIEAIQKGREEVQFSEILEFEDMLNGKLEEDSRNFYSDVRVEDVAETVGVFCRYFHERNGTIRIVVDAPEKATLLSRLITFFRSGLSRWLSDLMGLVGETVFAA